MPDKTGPLEAPQHTQKQGLPPSSVDDHYLQQYKLAVEMADRISGRRATANGFFLTLNSALVVTIGVTKEPTQVSATKAGDPMGLLLLAVAGIVVCITWSALLRSYRILNNAKFIVIHTMEQLLPAAPYKHEWDLLRPRQAQPWWNRYLELGTVERLVPLVFAAIYIAAIIRILVK